MNDSPLVEMHDVGKTFDNKAFALKELNLVIPLGQVVGLIGANGSGKTTLMHLISGQLPLSEGSMQILGASPSKKRSVQLRRQITMVPQDPALDPEMTANETLVLFGVLYGQDLRQAKTRSKELLKKLGLAELVNRRVSRMSGGQRQRLHLALAFIHAPKLLLFDEPDNALDPLGRKLFWKLVSQGQSQERSTLIITHNWQGIEQHCDRVIVLSDGRKVADDSPGGLIKEQDVQTLEEAFISITGQQISIPKQGRGPGRGGGAGRGGRR